MKKFLLAVILCSTSWSWVSFAVASDCSTWRLEVENFVTKETKLYTYATGDDRQIPIPELKNFKCSFSVARHQEGTTAGLICESNNKKEHLAFTTAASCLEASTTSTAFSTRGMINVNGLDLRTGKITWYNFSFSPVQ